MAVAFVGGAALGAAFGLLFDAVKKNKDKAVSFEFYLESIASTLKSLEPLIEEIEKGNRILDLPHGKTTAFDKEMEEGKKLVQKCSEIGKCNFVKKIRYTYKLQKLDRTLSRLFQLLQAKSARDVKAMRIKVEEMHAAIMVNGGYNSVGDNNQIISAISCDVPPLPPVIVGLNEPLKYLKTKLLVNGESSLVVSAPGGCGKTVLAKMFCHDDDVKEKFENNIFFFSVSKTPPSLCYIVRQLYEHKKIEVPVIANETAAINLLEEFMNQIGPSPILLVLDDVWPETGSHIEKLILKIPGYKILVTSREKLPKFGPQYPLRPLDDEDAMALFRHHCPSLEDGSSDIPGHIVKEMVDYYKAFPLALEIAGGSLSGKPAEFWQIRLKECSSVSSRISSDSNKLLSFLQSILNDLKYTSKECFMDLGSFPEDRRIPAAALIDMWTELYDLEEDVMAITNLFDLTIRNLANLVVTRKDAKELDGYYCEHFVTQHDLLRDLAIDQGNQEQIRRRRRLIMNLNGDELPNWFREHCFKGKEYIKEPFSAHLLSISTDENFSSNWFDMQLPEAKVLILNFRTKDYTLPKFVKNMNKLKVLVVTNYSYFPAGLSNFQLLGALKNLKRIRLERILITSIIKTPVRLKNLQKISLFMCNIGEAFSNCPIKISELLPKLKEMNVDFCNDLVELPVELCDIIHLKRLSITHCPKLSALPKEIGKLENLEVLRIRSCIDLLELPESIRNLSKLTFIDISDCSSIQNLPEHIGELRNLKKLNMTNCSRLQDLPQSVMELQQLEVLICDEERKQLWEPFLHCLNNIEIRVTKEDINLNWLPKFKS